MFEGWFVQDIRPVDEIMPYPPYPMYPSGLMQGDDAIYRYSLKSSDYPTLILVDPLFDKSRNLIPPGYYELALSDDRQFLILMQTKNPVAIIPVFKVEEDQTEVDNLRDEKYQKKLEKERKKQAKQDAKRAKTGVPPEEKEIYMHAEIEYVAEGNYYLLKYERDKIRAWGAVKK